MKRKLVIIGVFASGLFFGACKKESKNDPAPIGGETKDISGEVSGTWTKGNTYRITDDIFINEGKSLTIEPGVTLLFADSTEKPEVIVQGNLYAIGTANDPIKFTVDDALKAAKPWGQLWGGIIAGPKSNEIVVQHAVIEYGGATTTAASASVKAGLYKAAAGENVPVLYANNVNGKIVFTNNIVRQFAEDGLYIEGGQVIIANNTIHTNGRTGGDAINIKSGVIADVAFNLIYSPNTNALKLSNTGGRSPQAHVIAYNNTIVNAGWRRPTVKGGSVWVEQTVYAEIYNTLFVNDRFGIKRDTKSPEDTRSAFSNNYYFGSEQVTVDQFQPSTEIVGGTNDVKGTVAGLNDPTFENYATSTDKNNSQFSTSWDFHLKTGSPALGKGKIDFTRSYSTGISINGLVYSSPVPADFVGAFGKK